MDSMKTGKGKWWLMTAAAFLVINAIGVWQVARLAKAMRLRPAVAVTFAPGNGAELSARQELSWHFGAPTAPKDKVGVWSTEGPVSFSPAVNGRFCWSTAQDLTFEPAEPWTDCTEFVARLGSGSQGQAGKEGGQAFTFHTPALELDAVSRKTVTPSRELVLTLAFSAKPDPVRLKDFVTVETDGGKVGYDVIGDAATRVVTIQTAPIRYDDAVITVKKGLPPRAGSRGLERSTTKTFELDAIFRVNRMAGQCRAFSQPTIGIDLSSSVKDEALSSHIMIEPPVAFTAGRHYSDITLHGAFVPGATYKVTVRAGLKNEEGDTLGTNVTRTVYMPDLEPSVSFPAEGSYLSARGSKLVALNCANVKKVKVTAERVYPNNLVYFAQRMASAYDHSYALAGCARDMSVATATREYAVPYVQNVATQAYLHMDDLMDGRRAGAFLLGATVEKQGTDRHLVIVTDIGIVLKRSAKDVLVWANSLATLAPVSNAAVTVYSRANQVLARGTTDSRGVARIAGSFATNDTMPFVVTVESGDDISYLSVENAGIAGLENTDGRAWLGSGCEAYVFTDRGAYRPGETVHAEAVVRDMALQCPQPFPVGLRVRMPSGRIERTLNGMLGEFGTVEFTVPLPTSARTGRYTLEAIVPGSDTVLGETTVAVEEFVPPQIGVKVATDDGRAATAFPFTVSARYLFGRPAAGLTANAAVTFRAVPFVHPRWPDYVFCDDEKEFDRPATKRDTQTLDADGAAQFTVEPDSDWCPPSALRACMTVTVNEPGGRAVCADVVRDVDVYPFYLGIKQSEEGATAQVGSPQHIPVAAVMPDGSARTSSLSLLATLSRVSWSYALRKGASGMYSYESSRSLAPVTNHVVALDGGTGAVTLVVASPGQYLLVVEDTNTGVSASTQFYAAVPGDSWTAWSMEKPGRVELELDRKSYVAGDTATLLLKAPFAGTALVTIESDHVLDARVVVMTANTARVAIPVTKEYSPNVYCGVSIIRPVTPGGEKAPHRAVGVMPLMVNRPEKRLALALDAPAQVKPMTDVHIGITVGSGGSNVPPTEIALAAVDEAICSLTKFESPDPLGFFEAQRRLGVEWFDLYHKLMPEISNSVARTPSSPGGGEAESGIGLDGRLNPVDAKRFKPVALWVSRIRTDSNGHATATVRVPEFAGSLRLMAVAVAKDGFGSARSAVTVKREVVVKSSLPRFLAPGDVCTMPITIFNESTGDQHVTLSLATTGSVAASFAITNVSIKKGAQCPVTTEITAQLSPGTAALALGVRTANDAFDETTEIAVRPPASLVTQAGAGSVPPRTVTNIFFPDTWFAGTARNTLWCSGLPSISLCSGLEFLLAYPYGCLEQTVSASFPLLYLSDLAAAARPGSMTRDDTAQYVQAGILRVLSMQQYNGSFAYWPRCNDTWAWGSVYATHFLVEAGKAGFEVPKDNVDEALSFLERHVEELDWNDEDDMDHKWHGSAFNRAYACWVLAAAGKRPADWLAWLGERQDKLDVPSKVVFAAALSAMGRRPDAASILRSTGIGAVDALPRQTGDCLNSPVRTWALMVIAWLDTDPQAAEIIPLVKRLNERSTNGTWLTTQDTAMSLLALGRYAQQLAAQKKPFNATVSWNGRKAVHAIDATKEWRCDPVFGAGTWVVVSNAGPGTLYFTWQSKGVPATGTVAACDQNIKLRRELLDADGKSVSATTLQQGILYVSKLTVIAEADMRSMVIEDLLPAGLEIENPNLATSESIPWLRDKNTISAQHVERRDDRVIVFADTVDQGTNTFYTSVRAVTPGIYVHPPATVECMYDPSVRSVTGTGCIRVKE